LSFLTALGYYAGARGKAKQAAEQQQSENAYRQSEIGINREEMGIERERLAQEKTRDAATLAQTQLANAQTASNRQFESSLRLPPNWGKMNPEQQYNYLGVRYSEAQRRGDDTAATQTLAFMNSLPRAGQEFANTQYTRGAKTDLTAAQAGWWRGRHNEVMQALSVRLQTADAATRQRAEAARLHAKTALAVGRGGLSNDEREYIATLAALNGANGQESTQAFNEAMKQFGAASQQWQAQQKIYQQTGQAPAGFDPSNPPQAQTFINNMQPAAPSVNYINVTLPDGSVRKAPVITRTLPQQKHDPKKARELVQVSRANNFSDDEIREKMEGLGYTPQEIKAYMGKSLKMQGGGF
jgi:hypothetical protein